MELTVLHIPATTHNFICFDLFGSQRFGIHGLSADRVGHQTFPSLQVFPVEQGHKSSTFWHGIDMLANGFSQIAAFTAGENSACFFQKIYYHLPIKMGVVQYNSHDCIGISGLKFAVVKEAACKYHCIECFGGFQSPDDLSAKVSIACTPKQVF